MSFFTNVLFIPTLDLDYIDENYPYPEFVSCEKFTFYDKEGYLIFCSLHDHSVFTDQKNTLDHETLQAWIKPLLS